MRRFAIVSIFTLALGVLAADAAQAEGYGQAGCGLGSILIKKNTGVQIFAATTNGISGNQTFAMSTGTSNCDGFSGEMKSAKSFVETNRQAVAKDISRGNGETIASLTTIGGCASPDIVGAALQKNYDKIFPSSSLTDTQVAENVVRALKWDTSLQCVTLN